MTGIQLRRRDLSLCFPFISSVLLHRQAGSGRFPILTAAAGQTEPPLNRRLSFFGNPGPAGNRNFAAAVPRRFLPYLFCRTARKAAAVLRPSVTFCAHAAAEIRGIIKTWVIHDDPGFCYPCPGPQDTGEKARAEKQGTDAGQRALRPL